MAGRILPTHAVSFCEPTQVVFRPHHMHSIEQTRPIAIATQVWAWPVCVYVMGMNPAKTAKPIEMAFGMWAWVGPHNHVTVLDQVWIHPGDGAIFGVAYMGMPVVSIFNKMMWLFIEFLLSLFSLHCRVFALITQKGIGC